MKAVHRLFQWVELRPTAMIDPSLRYINQLSFRDCSTAQTTVLLTSFVMACWISGCSYQQNQPDGFSPGDAPDSVMSGTISPYDEANKGGEKTSPNAKSVKISERLSEYKRYPESRVPVLDLYPVEALPGRHTVISVNGLGEVERRNFKEEGEPEVSMIVDLQSSLETARFSGDGSLLAYQDREGIGIYSLVKLERIALLKDIKTEATSLFFHPDLKSLLIGGADGRVYIWGFDPEYISATGHAGRLERYSGPGTVVSSVVFHPFGKVFFSGDWMGGITSWLRYGLQGRSAYKIESLLNPQIFVNKTVRGKKASVGSAGVEDLAVSSDGKMLAASLQNGILEVLQVRGYMPLASVQAHTGLIYALAVNRDGSMIATSGRDGKLKVWKLREKNTFPGDPFSYLLQQTNEFNRTQLVKLAFGSGMFLYAGGSSGDVLQLDLEKGKVEESKGDGA